MKRWVITSTIDAAKLPGVVSSRCGRFVAYDRFLQRWVMVYPGGETEIEEPQMLFLDEHWARENRTLGQSHKRENPLRIRKKKCEQLVLF